MRFGVMQGVLGAGDDAACFARAKSLGFDGIELNLSVAEMKHDDYARLRDLKKLQDSGGMPIVSLVLGEHNSGGIATWWRGPDADEEVLLALKWCGKLGVDTLLLPFFFFNEPKGKAHRDAVAERLEPLCQAAAKHKTVIAFEGVVRAEHLQEMAGQIKSPGFGVYYDVANATWCDYDVPAEIRLLGKLIRQVHAKEAKVFTGDVHLGEGRVDHAAAAEALKEIAYNRWIVLETPGGTDAHVMEDLAFARKIYGKD